MLIDAPARQLRELLMLPGVGQVNGDFDIVACGCTQVGANDFGQRTGVRVASHCQRVEIELQRFGFDDAGRRGLCRSVF